MVRSLTQWTKTLSFPARMSPNRGSKECVVNVHPVAPPSPGGTPPPPERKGAPTPPPRPITEISQIIYPDADQEKSLIALPSAGGGPVVFCVHQKLGCQWAGELRTLKAHLTACKHDATPCRNRCGAQIPRVMMPDHLRYTCPERRAACEHCEREFSGHALENHNGNCSHEPVYCENKCGAKVQRRRMSAHRSGECPKRMLPCRHCLKEFVGDTMGAHHALCSRLPVPCPQRCERPPMPREELDAHLKDECDRLQINCSFREAGCRFKGPRQSMEAHLLSNCSQHLQMMVALSTRQTQQINSLRNAVASLSLNYSGTLVWKLSDWTAKMLQAKGQDGVELLSPPFYTSQYGYKLQASVFLNGNGAGEGTHVSVYIKILPGEYDALLRWPFSHSVSFTLFDQSQNKSCNVVESFIPDPTWENFQRPSRAPDALGFGFPRFVSHEMLNRRSFIKDDTVFIRVKVDPSKIVAV